jgi:hypothetical protein
MKSPRSMTTAELEPFAKEWLSRTRKGKTFRPKVKHLCPYCKDVIVGTREFRRHKPQCRKFGRACEEF